MIHKLYGIFSFGFGIYGFSRGYRSSDITREDRLTTTRIVFGIINSMIYAAPIVNIIPLNQLINRIEIEKCKLNKLDYSDNYMEIVGICDNTY